MLIKCIKCRRKFHVDTNENGVPKRFVCDRCRARELKKELEKIVKK